MATEQYWGYHLALDCKNCNLTAITSAEVIKHFAKELVKEIDMVAYGEPQVVNFGSGNKEGYTLVQLIETSNICAHFANEDRAAYIDVFSCKPFPLTRVIDTVEKIFQPETIKTHYLLRQA